MKTFSTIILAVLVSSLFAYHFLYEKTNETPEGGGFKKLDPANLAIMRADYEFMKLRDPKTDEIPPNIKTREAAFAKIIAEKARKNASALAAPNLENVENVGPDNVCGRVLAVKEDLEDGDLIYAATASGGFWASYDGGVTWFKKSPFVGVQSGTCIAQDPNDADVIYYGTGEMLSTTDRRISLSPRTLGIGNGIYKTDDRGETWELLPSTISDDLRLEHPFQGVWNIALDATNPDNTIVYAACYGEIMKSVDGGDSWEPILGDPNTRSFCTYVVVDPDGKLFAALGGFTQSGETPDRVGIFTSDDGGENWSSVTPENFNDETRTIKLAADPSNPGTIYALTERPIPDDDPTYGFTASEHKLYKITANQDGVTWTDYSINLPGAGTGDIISGASDSLHGAFNSIGGYALALAIDPSDENGIYAGGISLFRNTDGFRDSTSNAWLGGYPYNDDFSDMHPDIHSIYFSIHNPNRLYIGCDGGVFFTDDYLAPVVEWTWRGAGLNNTQFYWVSQDPTETDPDRFLVGGVQDNAVYYERSFHTPGQWDFVIGGDGLTVEVADDKEFILCSVYNGNIFSFTLGEHQIVDNLFYIRPDQYDDELFNFYTNFVLDPNDNKTFYLAGKSSVYKNEDIAKIALDSSLKNEGWTELAIPELSEGEEVITSVNVSHEPANILYVGTNSGKVYKGVPNGEEYVWSNVTGEMFPEGGFISRIDIDRFDASRIVAVCSNYEVLSVFASDDGGDSWESVSGNLEQNPDGSGAGPSVRWVSSWSAGPDETRAYLAGTSLGLFQTTQFDGDQTIWTEIAPEIIGDLIVDMVDVRPDGRAAIATQGGGVFSGKFDSESGVDDNLTVISSSAYPNPSFGPISIDLESEAIGIGTLEVFDASGSIVLTTGFEKVSDRETIEIDLSEFASGVYYFRATIGENASAGKIVKN